MIDGLKPYPEYRETALPWLAGVPAHWGERRMKAMLRERVEKGQPELPLLAATQTMGVVRKDRYENRTVVATKDLHLLKVVEQGDFVISLRSFEGGIEYARDRGIISPAYTILTSRGSEQHGYLAHLFKSDPFIDQLKLFVTGIREGQNIDYDSLSRQALPLPPVAEQGAIVRFIDHVDRQVRRYIMARQKQIKLVDEERQAIIHRAVTCGTSAAPRLAGTTSRWFPLAPVHWRVLPMGRLVQRAVDGPHHSPRYVDEGVPFISARNIKADRWSLEDAKYISEADYNEYSKRIKPEPGDVLYTKGGTTGVARAVDLAFPFQVWVHIAVLKLARGLVDPAYLAMALNSTRCYEQAQLLTRGATNQDLGLGRMKTIEVPVPPLAEQREIVAAVARQTEGLTRAMEYGRSEVALARELRTRLIADVVTGKVDVRPVVAGLGTAAAVADWSTADADTEDAHVEDGPEVGGEADE